MTTDKNCYVVPLKGACGERGRRKGIYSAAVQSVSVERVYRLIDANANRAREGIRTAEDYVRFLLGEHRWVSRLSAVRRGITETLGELVPDGAVSAARRVRIDVGNPEFRESLPSSTPGESPGAVALRGLKRAQEALRVLEEFVRSEREEISDRISRMRFALYEAEQWLSGGCEAARTLAQTRVYVVLTERVCRRPWLEAARLALRGGARVLQLREKDLPDREVQERASRLRDLCAEAGALLIVNDRADLALASRAHGVHLGQEDLAPGQVRRIAGEALVVGRSTHGRAEARQAVVEEAADYLAVGAMFETKTKLGAVVKGPELAREVLRESGEVPVFAIGGIRKEHLPQLKRAGVTRVAVSAAVLSAEDPEGAAREIGELLEAQAEG